MMRLDARRHGTPLSAMAIAVVIACSSPTDVCGCTPMPPSVVVVGTVTDASGAAVVGARLLFDGVPEAMAVDPPLIDFDFAVTDQEGEFADRVLNWEYAMTELVLRAAVVEAGTTDTIRLRLGPARFRTGARIDTIRVAISIP